MKTLTLLGMLFAFAMGATALAEGISEEDTKCSNRPTCLQSPADEDHRSAS